MPSHTIHHPSPIKSTASDPYSAVTIVDSIMHMYVSVQSPVFDLAVTTHTLDREPIMLGKEGCF